MGLVVGRGLERERVISIVGETFADTYQKCEESVI